MSGEVYNALTFVLLCCALTTLLIGVLYLAGAILGWRGPNRKHRLVRFALFLTVFPVCGAIQQSLLWYVFLPSLGRENKRMISERLAASSLVHVGDQAPSFRLTNTEGVEFNLDDFRGNLVLVNFFATWCGPCLHELPHVQEIYDKHHDDSRFALIVIGREETAESVAEFRRKHGYTFPMAPDPDRSVYSLYAEESIPRTFLIGTDGKICFSTISFDEEDFSRLKAEVVKKLSAHR